MFLFCCFCCCSFFYYYSNLSPPKQELHRSSDAIKKTTEAKEPHLKTLPENSMCRSLFITHWVERHPVCAPRAGIVPVNLDQCKPAGFRAILIGIGRRTGLQQKKAGT